MSKVRDSECADADMQRGGRFAYVMVDDTVNIGPGLDRSTLFHVEHTNANDSAAGAARFDNRRQHLSSSDFLVVTIQQLN